MERQRAVRKPPESLGAWEVYQRGLWHMARLRAADNEMAMSEALDEGLSLARRAVSLDPTDAFGHSGVGLALTLRGDYQGGLAEVRGALAINPNLAFAHATLGVGLVHSGSPRDAMDAISKALRHDPYDPLRFIRLAHISLSYYYLGEYEAAVKAARSTIRSYPEHPWVYRTLAAALGQLGHLDEARDALQKAIDIAPKAFDMYVRQRAPMVRPEDYGHMLEGLRKAGWEG